MKLSEIQGDRALDVFADILEPGAAILSDEEVRDLFRAGKRLPAVRAAIKNHKEEVKAILAAMDGVEVKDLKINVITLPIKLLEIFNDPEVLPLFSSPSQTESPSGNTSETTTAENK